MVAICDLPAARKVASMASFKSKIFCTVCDCWHFVNAAGDKEQNINTLLQRTDHHVWKARDVFELRTAAERWRDASSIKEQALLFTQFGVRWSELWRLPYWNPTRMLAVDSMHCLLEGLARFNTLTVLRLTKHDAKAKGPSLPAFHHDFLTPLVEDKLVLESRDKNYMTKGHTFGSPWTTSDVKHVDLIHWILTAPFVTSIREPEDPDVVNATKFMRQLMGQVRPALKYVVDSLNLKIPNTTRSEPTKKDYCDALLQWVSILPALEIYILNFIVPQRLPKPHQPTETAPKDINLQALEMIRHIIKDIKKPSWVRGLLANFGSKAAGTPKADEWRMLYTVYLPIALVMLWGRLPYDHCLRQVLDHTMYLVTAIQIVCSMTMSEGLAREYQSNLWLYIDGLKELFPHVASVPNMHMAFHVYDFLILFGPVCSWWTFPFERLVGLFQRLLSNHILGKPAIYSFSSSHELRQVKWKEQYIAASSGAPICVAGSINLTPLGSSRKLALSLTRPIAVTWRTILW